MLSSVKRESRKWQEPTLADPIRRSHLVDGRLQPQHVSLDGATVALRGRQPARRRPRVRRRLASRRHSCKSTENAFRDFISPPTNIFIAQKYTDKNTGDSRWIERRPLMGAMITQRPDLFRAVVCAVPLLDMLRYQNFQIAKLWIPEYGSAEDAKQFELALCVLALSSRKAGRGVSRHLFMTGDTDTRVDPSTPRKWPLSCNLRPERRQQRKTNPAALDIKAGHGQGKPVTKQIEESTDMYSFLFWQLGVKP